MKKLLLVTAVALINKEGCILLAQRPKGKQLEGLWEFPGGKVDEGETPEEALARELKEELDITVHLCDLKPLAFASHTYPEFHLLMPLFLCRAWQGEIKAMEHDSLAWVCPKDFNTYPMPPADTPLAKTLAAQTF